MQIKANFSTNVWYEADTRPLCDFLSTHLEGIFHYPEPDAGSFRKVAAACHGLTPEQVLVGNGATELFYMVAHAFSGNRTLIPVPSFTEYEDACTLYDHHIQFVGQVDVEHIPEHTNLMFICNPNNPDGRIWNLEEITALVKKLSGYDVGCRRIVYSFCSRDGVGFITAERIFEFVGYKIR